MKAPAFWWSEGNGLWSVLLAPAACLYGAAAARKFAKASPVEMPVPVVCIGNLVAGGAGKTPVALDIGARLIERGAKPHFLSRGYGGSLPGPVRVEPEHHGFAEVGDEPLLLAEVAPAWISRDRVAGCEAAVAAGAGAIIMDDGFQNPAVHKTLSLVVVDGRRGFGNRRLIPAGPLREPVRSGLQRADGVVLMGGGAELARQIRSIAGEGLPILHAHLKPGPEWGDLAGKPVVAFAGLGDPGKFFASLEAAGCRIKARRGFADHHPYAQRDLDRLTAEAERHGAALVTTAKDAMRLPDGAREDVRVLTIRVEWEDEGRLNELLEKAVPVSR